MDLCLCRTICFLFVYGKLVIHQSIHIYSIILVYNFHIILLTIHRQCRCCLFCRETACQLLIDLRHCQPLFHSFLLVNGELDCLITALLSIGNFGKSFHIRDHVHDIIADLQQLVCIASIDIHSQTACHIRRQVHIRSRNTVILELQLFADFFQLFCHRAVIPGCVFIQ